MTRRRNALPIVSALALPVLGAVAVIVTAYLPTWNGLDLLAWVAFVLGVMRLIRNPGPLLPRRGRR